MSFPTLICSAPNFEDVVEAAEFMAELAVADGGIPKKISLGQCRVKDYVLVRTLDGKWRRGQIHEIQRHEGAARF